VSGPLDLPGPVWDHLDLGVLTCEIPPGLIDEVVDAADCRERRRRKLPARLAMYFVLACCLFCGAERAGPPGYRAVMTALLRRLRTLCRAQRYTAATSSALTRARQRLGDKPFALLFDRLRGPLAAPDAGWARVGGLRLVAWDGTTLEVPDSPANAARFGYHGHRDAGRGDAGGSGGGRRGAGSGVSRGASPLVRLMALIECGTHAVLDAEFDQVAASEQALARRLLASLEPGMLLLADRNFCGHDLWGAAAATGAHLAWRASATSLFPAVQILPDGTYLSRIPTRAQSQRYAYARRRGRPLPVPTDGHLVRIITYTVTLATVHGHPRTEHFRLATTLLDPHTAPAAELAAAYAQRWEAETCYSELKTRLRGPDIVLRSKTPTGVHQEIYAFLVLYQALCKLRAAAATTGEIDPDRISFTVTLRAARAQLTDQTTHSPTARQQARRDTIEELLTERLNPRRARHYPRQRRPPKNKYDTKRRDQPRPTGRTTYTITITRADTGPLSHRH
jgi:hypothetical protein